MARTSDKTHLRTIGRKPIHGNIRTVKRAGDLVLVRNDAPAVRIAIA